MKNKLLLCTMVLFLILGLSACAATPTVDVNLMNTMVAQNVLLTQAAATMTEISVQLSATPLPTETPSATKTPTSTPEPSVTPTTLKGVWLFFDQTTNCRFGPGTEFSRVAIVGAGNQLEALARSEDGEFYYVNYFDTSNKYCWVWKGTSYVTGNPKSLPVFTPQPTAAPSITPTVDAGIKVSYLSVQSCSGAYSLLFQIKNVGNTTWQSVRIEITDTITGTKVTHTANAFTGYEGCAIHQQEGDLTTGEPSLVSAYNPGQFNYDPSGHLMSITVTVYSAKDLNGSSVSRSLQITP